MPVFRNATANVVARNLARLIPAKPNLAVVRGRLAAARACEPVIEHLERRQLMAADFGTAAAGSGTSDTGADFAPLAVESPSVVSTTPANGSTNVRLDASILANSLYLPNGGVASNTVIGTGNVTLRRVDNGALVNGEAGVSGGGDSITFSVRDAYLAPNTEYRFEISAGVKDVTGVAFTPYSGTFRTGTTGGPVATPVSFTNVAQANALAEQYTAVAVGPDLKLYAATFDGQMYRFNIGTDGTLSGRQPINTVNDRSTTGTRTITGIVFTPNSTATNLIAWVTHAHKADTGGPNFTSKLSRLSGANLESYQDYVIGLPRSTRDHLTNQPVYRPGEPNSLYITQGSMNAMGAPDTSWGLNANETLLSAAILKVDIPTIANRINAGQGPLNVQTSGVANPYNPYAAGAAVKLHATGVRNGYDLVWHSNGKLYSAVNGSAAGGNTPASVHNSGRRPPSGAPYTGQSVPGLTNVGQKEHDWLFNVEAGRYYGHPNPARGEFVYNGGNPSTAVDPGQIDAYPVGIQPDANWRRAVYDFGESVSPNGIIEYKSNRFGGALQNKLLVVRYAGGDDIIALTPRADGSIDVGQTVNSVGGKSPFVDPVDLIEFVNPADANDARNGMIFVAEYGGKRLTLMRPNAATTPPPVPPGNPNGGPPAVVGTSGSRIQLSRGTLVFNAVRGQSSGTGRLTIRNNGTTALSLTGLTLGGTSAGSFAVTGKPTLPHSLAAGASTVVSVVYRPAAAAAPGIQTATLTVASNDPTRPSIVVGLRGLTTVGTGGQNEASLQRLFDLYELRLQTGDRNAANTNLYSNAEPLGPSEEVTVQRLVKAGTGQVTVQALGTFAGGSPAARFGWYQAGNAGARAEVLTINSGEAQSVNLNPVGASTFDPGGATFGLYVTFPIFGNTAYSEDNLNTGEGTVGNRRKVRFYPLKSPDGTTVPNAYVFTSEDFVNGDGSFDVNDFFGIVRNVRIAGASTGTGVTVSNLDGAPFDDRLIFNRINIQPPEPLKDEFGNSYNPPPNVVHDKATVRITNNKSAAITVSSVAVNNTSVWKVLSGPPAGTVLQPGQSVNVTVQFIATTPPATSENETVDPTGVRKNLNGTYAGTLTVNTTDGAKTVQLAGYFQHKNEDNQEANVETLINKVFGYATNVVGPGQSLVGGGRATAVGEEVLSGLWTRVDASRPVTVRQLAAQHGQGKTSTLQWYAQGSSTLSTLFTHAADQGQTYLPTTAAGVAAAGSFNPAGAFGFKNDTEWSEDARNKQEQAGGGYGHHVRFWPARDRAGVLIPNTYIMGVDYQAINYDYQDNLYLVTNVRAANGAGPNPGPVDPGTGPSLAGLDLIDAVTDQVIGPFTSGTSLNLTGREYTVRANPGTGTIGSVVFRVDGNVVRTENFAPYSIAGENGATDYLPWYVPSGNHTVTVTAYAGANGTGTAGPTITAAYDAGFYGNPPPAGQVGVTGLTLIDAATDQPIGPVTDGMTIDLAGGRQYSVRAEVTGTTKSVVFKLDGTTFRTESAAPYATGGDSTRPDGSIDYGAWTVATGTRTLNVQGFGAAGGTGTAGSAVTVTLNVVNGGPVSPPPGPTPSKLAGAAIGTAGSYNNGGNTIARALDGSLSTYFDAPATNISGAWVGLDLGSDKVITSVAFAPRASWAARMVGAKFQGSSSADFSAGVVDLHTVSATPPAGTLTTVAVNPAAAGFRYVRYLAPANSYGNVAEVQFFGRDPDGGPVSPPPPPPVAPPPPPVATAPSLAGLTLINADTDADIGPLRSGAVIDTSNNKQYTVRADPATAGPAVASVVFKVDGQIVATDNSDPFTIAGEDGINLLPWLTGPGAHTVEVTPFAQAGGQGDAGAAVTVNVTLENNPQSPPPPPPPVVSPPPPPPATTGPALDLLNSVDDSVIAPFTNGYTIDMNQTGTRLNVRATPVGTPGSLVFKLDGATVSTETYAPYSVGGDSNGGFNDWTPPAGTHTLEVLQYSGAGGTGTVQGTTTVSFTAVAPQSPPPPAPPAPPTSPAPVPSSSGTFAGLNVGSGASGSTASGGANAWVVQGAGNGLTGTADAFHFARQARSGDFDIKAKLASLTGGAAGLLVRNGTLAPSSEVSVQFANGGVHFGTRDGYGKTFTIAQRGSGTAGNVWLRLKRAGNTFTAYYSADGTTWTTAGAATIGSIPTTADLGFSVAGGVNSLVTARFESVAG